MLNTEPFLILSVLMKMLVCACLSRKFGVLLKILGVFVCQGDEVNLVVL